MATASTTDARRTPALAYARIAGLLLLVSAVAGGFGEFFVPSTLIVRGDATATAHNLLAHPSLFRLGFASYLVEAICDVTLSLLFYLLLRPVRRDLALLAAFFGLVSTAVYAVAELFYFASSQVLAGSAALDTFTPEQRANLALFLLKLFGLGGGLFLSLYGVASLVRGYLIFRSGFLPRVLGGLLALVGVAFIAHNFLLVVVPAYASSYLLAPAPLAVLVLGAWLLIRGVDVAKWDAAAARAASGD